MRQFVLRQGLQRGTTASNGAVQVQISLVLLRAMSELHGGGMDHGLQIRRKGETEGESQRLIWIFLFLFVFRVDNR